MITVESNPDSVQITIPRDELRPEQIEAILRPLRFAGMVAATRMTKEEALNISDESKSDWWAKHQARFIPPSGD